MPQTLTPQGFAGLNLPEPILQTLNRYQFFTPTPIQAQAIPVGIEGLDLIGIAKTGTGKTLAFGVPIAVRLKRGQTALVLVPTRELAIQVQETLLQLGLRTACIIGGAPMNRQVRELRSNPAVIVATPGRLIDHLNQRTTNLNRVSLAVLDEADRMFDMGFAPAVRKILSQVPKGRQTLMFSATMPKEICDLASEELVNPVRVEIEPPGTITDNVAQEVWTVPFEQKQDTLEHILHGNDGSTLVFTRTRHGARKLANVIRSMGYSADEIHSDRTLNQRRDAMHSFKSGAIQILVATDIAARGIDVKEIGLVLNYDVPENPEDYIHRIGRTGRAGNKGRAITIATPQQHRTIKDIEKLLKTPLPRFNASGIAERARIDGSSENRPTRNQRSVSSRNATGSSDNRNTLVRESHRQPNSNGFRSKTEDSFRGSKPDGRTQLNAPHDTEGARRNWSQSQPENPAKPTKKDSRPKSGDHRPPRSTSNAKRPGKPTWKRGAQRTGQPDRNGAMPKEPKGGRQFSTNDSRYEGGQGRQEFRESLPYRGSDRGSAPSSPKRKPRTQGDWSGKSPFKKEKRDNSPAHQGDAPVEARSWTANRNLVPKQFRKPKRAKSYVTRQVIAKKAKQGGISRFEKIVSQALPSKSPKRKS